MHRHDQGSCRIRKQQKVGGGIKQIKKKKPLCKQFKVKKESILLKQNC